MKASDTLELVALFEASYSREVTDTTKKLWIELFENVDRADAFDALNLIAATENYPPTPQSIRQRALMLPALMRDFSDVWREMIDAASTCDYFDNNPPESLSDEALALAHTLSWPQFRVSDVSDTYYVHHARQMFDEIIARAQRNLAAGRPAFENARRSELPSGFGQLIEGIFEKDDDA